MAEYNNGLWVCHCQHQKECNRDCGMYRKLSGKPSNADRIRAMSDEELAGILNCVPEYRDCPPDADDCRKCILDWLKKEVEGESDGQQR